MSCNLYVSAPRLMRIECSSWRVGEASHQKPHTKEPVSIRVAATLSAALGQRLKRLAPRPKRRAPSTRTYRVAWHVDGTVSAVRKTASASVTLYISQTCGSSDATRRPRHDYCHSDECRPTAASCPTRHSVGFGWQPLACERESLWLLTG